MQTVGIIGGSGYTGVELLRLLLPRDDVTVSFVSSRANSGSRLDYLFPSLRGQTDLCFSQPDLELMSACDLVFFATPNGTAMKQAAELIDNGIKIIDLSADFRLKDLTVWEHWYGMSHACPDLISKAVYGLPEIFRDQIRSAQLVANPGCYPTAVQLGFLPLLENDLVATDSLKVSDSFRPYGTSGHRHLPEIEQGLRLMTNHEVDLTFSPHLLPIIRGIHATLYARLTADIDLDSLQVTFEKRFKNEAFVDVMPMGALPETRSVKGSNMCRIAVHIPQGRKTVVVHAIEDNLVKGAAGQAVQNMNLMLGFEETAGLGHTALIP